MPTASVLKKKTLEAYAMGEEQGKNALISTTL